jgi:hypothetical protein
MNERTKGPEGKHAEGKKFVQEKKKGGGEDLPEKSMPVRAVMSMGTANVHRVTWVPLRSQ